MRLKTKVVLLLLFGALLGTKESNAQRFDEESIFVNGGLTLTPGQAFQGTRSQNLPGLSVAYEQHYENLGPGKISLSVGSMLKTVRSEDFISSPPVLTNIYQSELSFIGKAHYYWDKLNKTNWQIYGGAGLGVGRSAKRYSHPIEGKKRVVKGLFFPVIAIGGRYKLSDNLWLFGEVCTGVSNPVIGISYKIAYN